jgi:hypothetical protein
VNATSKRERGPLYEWERLGIQPPPALKKVHSARHNNNDGGEPFPPNNNQQEASSMSNQSAEAIQPQSNVNPQPVAEAPQPQAPAPQQPAVLVEVEPRGTTAKDLNLNVTVSHVAQPEPTWKDEAKKFGKAFGVLVLALGTVEIAKATISHYAGGSDAPPVEG